MFVFVCECVSGWGLWGLYGGCVEFVGDLEFVVGVGGCMEFVGWWGSVCRLVRGATPPNGAQSVPPAAASSSGPSSAHGPLQAEPPGGTQSCLSPGDYMWCIVLAQPAGMYLWAELDQLLPPCRAPGTSAGTCT